MDCGAEWPAKDGVDGDVVAEGDGEKDGVAIRKGVWEDVSDYGAEEAVKIGGIEGVRVANSSGQPDRFEGLVGVVKVDETVDAGGVCLGELFVERVHTTVKTGAGVEQGSEVGAGVGLRFAECEGDSGQSGRNSDRDRSNRWFRKEVEGCDGECKLNGREIRIDSWLLRGSLFWLGGVVGFRIVDGNVWGVRIGGLLLWSSDVGGDFGWTGGGGWWIDDAFVGVTRNRVSIVIKLASVGVMSEELLEELLTSRRVVALRAWSAFTRGQTRMRDAAAKTATERAGVATLIFCIRIRINGVFIVGRIGVGRGCGGLRWAIIVAEDRFGRANVGGSRGDGLGAKNGGRFGVEVGGVGHEGRDLIAAEGAKKGVFFVDKLGGVSKSAKLR